jgi:hypothetical protein
MYAGRANRRPVQVVRSQLALRLGLAIYAVLCVAVILRSAVLVLGLPATVLTVRAILTASRPIVLPATWSRTEHTWGRNAFGCHGDADRLGGAAAGRRLALGALGTNCELRK